MLGVYPAYAEVPRWRMNCSVIPLLAPQDWGDLRTKPDARSNALPLTLTAGQAGVQHRLANRCPLGGSSPDMDGTPRLDPPGPTGDQPLRRPRRWFGVHPGPTQNDMAGIDARVAASDPGFPKGPRRRHCSRPGLGWWYRVDLAPLAVSDSSSKALEAGYQAGRRFFTSVLVARSGVL